MKRREKTGLLLLIILFLFSCGSVSAFATVITPEDVQKALAESAAHAATQSSQVQSTASAASSRKSITSRMYSSGSSSDPSSGSSGEISSTASGEPSSSEIVLPSVGSVAEDNPLSSVIVNTKQDQKMKWIGIISWACIILGVLVVLIVVLSNRRPPKGGPGRKRYRPKVRSNKKRLLNDKYYRNIKY